MRLHAFFVVFTVSLGGSGVFPALAASQSPGPLKPSVADPMGASASVNSANASGANSGALAPAITTSAPELAAPSVAMPGVMDAVGKSVPNPSPVNPNAILVNIDGRVSSPDPAPLLSGGAVFVPLRGVLENLGAKVEYFPADRRIEITQKDKKYLLHAGMAGATVEAQIVPLTAPKMVGGRAFVPLRSLAELFGYRVAWLASQRTVAIYTGDDVKPVLVDHRAELKAGGAFGIEIDFSTVAIENVPILLEAAKNAGAGFVKIRFDWNTLQPEAGGEFQWAFFDTIVREARSRGLRLVGVLGNSAKWASVSTSNVTNDWRNSPPKPAQFEAWANYVKRTVGRYSADVQAWQVWENPSAENFHSVARTYRKLARLAVDAAKLSDPNAIVHAAEPGGVGLNFINDLTRNGLTPSLDGISVFPVSQWQPGVPNPTENFVLPYATLRDRLQLGDGKTRDYWVGGVSSSAFEVPIAADASASPLNDSQKGLLGAYSLTAQADYLTRLFALSLAGGAEKVFWTPLQDEATASASLPILSGGAGLFRSDGTPRPALSAFKLLSQMLSDKPYAGNLAFDSNTIALLFDNKKTGTLIAWSPSGSGALMMSSSGVDPGLKDAIFVATRPDSQVLDAMGKPVALPDGVLKLSNRPLFITNVASETAVAAATRQSTGSLRLETKGIAYDKSDEIKAVFTPDAPEEGLFWRRYSDFGGMGRSFSTMDGKKGLNTEVQRDIFDLKSQRPFIYLDVADDFLYFAGGVPVTATIEVHRTPKQTNALGASASGFRLEYDSPSGFKTTPWQQVEEGEGWMTYTFTLPDVNFANAEGYDLLINAGGSKRDLTFGSVVVRRAAPDPASVPVATVAKVDAIGQLQ